MTESVREPTSARGNGGSGAKAWWTDEEGFLAWTDLFQAYTLVVRALERRIGDEFGLPLAGFQVLARLANVPEDENVRMQELARTVLLSKGGLSQLFTRLEKRGLVERRGDPENLRVTYATVTEEGREVLARALPAFRAEIEERFAGHLGDEEMRTVRLAMGKVISASGERLLSEGPEVRGRGSAAGRGNDGRAGTVPAAGA